MKSETITIIEGPPPTFEAAASLWLQGQAESPSHRSTMQCLLRTFNSTPLLDRCRTAWRENRTVHLEYRQSDGLYQRALIIAAQAGNVPEGPILRLWIMQESDEALDQLDDIDFLDDDGARDS